MYNGSLSLHLRQCLQKIVCASASFFLCLYNPLEYALNYMYKQRRESLISPFSGTCIVCVDGIHAHSEGVRHEYLN